MVKNPRSTQRTDSDVRDFCLALTKIINALHLMQIWRRGGKNPMPLSPEAFGVVLDDTIRIMRLLRKCLIQKI